MTTRALIVPIVELPPHPPPYGHMHIGKGAWDQLQASKAYNAPLPGGDRPAKQGPALDIAI